MGLGVSSGAHYLQPPVHTAPHKRGKKEGGEKSDFDVGNKFYLLCSLAFSH